MEGNGGGGGELGLSLTMDYRIFAILQINIRNLIVYIVFLAFTCVVAYGRVNVDNFYFPKVVEGTFLDESWENDMPGYTFRDVGNIANFWSWAEGPLLDALYWEEWLV